MGGGRRHEGGRAVGGRQGEEEKNTGERGREGRMKKIGGEHITVGSYYNPAVMLTYHRQVHLNPAVIYYHRRFETNRR